MARDGKAKWLVFIAVSQYRSNEMGSLPGVVSDIERLDHAFHNFTDGEIIETFRLYNDDALKDRILATLAKVAEDAYESHQVIIYFGGHGHQVRGGDGPMPGDGMTRYLLPYEATWDSALTDGISCRELADAIAPIRASELVIILDTCHSGGFTGLFWPEIPSLQHSGHSRYVITTARPRQQAAETNEGSFFLPAFCDSLQGMEGAVPLDGHISAQTAYSYAAQKVKRLSRMTGHPQEATKADFGSDIYLTQVPLGVGTGILYHLRQPVSDFVGREEEIEKLIEALQDGGSAPIIGISGMGGIGKTELALKVANLLRSHYPDAQLMIEMRGTAERPLTPADALAFCIRPFIGLEARLPDELEELTNLYRNALSGKRALIVLDNAANSEQVRLLMPPEGCALLVTSRGTIALPGMKRVALEELEPDEARSLLMSIAPRVEMETANWICRLCDYLPLAIRAAGSLLDVTVDLDPDDYAEQLSDERTRLERFGTEGVDIGVEASFNLSYERLETDTLRVFRQLSVFPAGFDAAAEEAACEDAGHKHLSDLVKRNLAIYDRATKRYHLHDLVRLFAGMRISSEEKDAAARQHTLHYLGVIRQANDLYKQSGEAIKTGLDLFDLEWDNIEAGQQWGAENLMQDDETAWLCSQYPDYGRHLLLLRQHPRGQIQWREKALEAARRLKDRAAEGRHLGNLGNAYYLLGEYRRAIEFQEQHLTIAREVGDRLGEGQALGNLGLAHHSLGEYRRAIEFHEQDLAVAREIGDRIGEGGALGNLGIAYHFLGEYRRAIEFQEQRLAIAREIGDRLGEGQVLGNLGNAYYLLGEYRRAIEFHEQHLTIAREIGDRYGEGQALGHLGGAYHLLGEYRRAIEFHEQHLTIAREIGDRHGEGTALVNTSGALDMLGDRTEAIRLAEAALIIYESIESPEADAVRNKLKEWCGEK